MSKDIKDLEIFKWHGWGSPVGLGIFIVSLALSLVLVAQSVNLFVDAGYKSTRFAKSKDFVKEWAPSRTHNTVERNTPVK